MAEDWIFGSEKAHVWRAECDGGWFTGYRSLCGLTEGGYIFYRSRNRPYGGWQKRCKKCSKAVKKLVSLENNNA